MKWAAALLLILGAVYMGYHVFSLPEGGPHRGAPRLDEQSTWVMPVLGGLAALAGIAVWNGRKGLD